MVKLIFLAEESPFDLRGGGKLRAASLIQLLFEFYDEIDLLCFEDSGSYDLHHFVSDGKKLNIVRVDRDKRSFLRRFIGLALPYILNGYSNNMGACACSKVN